MNQFLKDHQLNKAEFGVTDGSISVWISGPQDKNPSIEPGVIIKNKKLSKIFVSQGVDMWYACDGHVTMV